MLLIHQVAEKISYPGSYVFVATASTGSATLQITIDGANWVDVTDAAWTADGTAVVELPRCRIRSSIVGDGTLTYVPLS